MIRFDAHRTPDIYVEDDGVFIVWPDAPFIIVLPCLWALVQLSSYLIQVTQLQVHIKQLTMPNAPIEELLGGRTPIPEIFREAFEEE